MNWNTTDGWGAFPSSESGQNNNTFDNLSGFGTSAPATTNGSPEWAWCNQGVSLSRAVSGNLPQGKKLVRMYKYNNRFFQRGGDMVFYNKKWVPVASIPETEKVMRIISV
jgi:hypothetical protein